MYSGIRQGCAVSALLFILAVEFLAVDIKNKDTINGIKLFQKTSTIIQYADDTTLTLKDRWSITEALKIINQFSAVSGLELNMDKCQGIWLGSLKDRIKIFEGIKFNSDPLKCLGIYIGTDKDACEKKNWEYKIQDISNIFTIWNNRNLTLHGKIVIINNLAIPKLIYSMTVLAMPIYVIQKLETLFYNFLWGKTHKIAKNVVIAKHEEGGLNLVDINTKHCALKTSWIPKIISQNNVKEVLNIYLSSIGINVNVILKMSFRKIESLDVIKKLPSFYQQLFLSFNMCKFIKPINKMSNFEMLSQPIWGNELFKSKEKCLFFKNWIESGFLLVKDLFESNGTFVSEEHILNDLNDKHNWISEYLILKKTVYRKISKVCDSSMGQFIQSSCYLNVAFTSKFGIIKPRNICSKDMYQILLDKKVRRPYTESMWQKVLSMDISKNEWKSIYLQNQVSLKYKKFSEFKYKILLNIAACGEKLSRWKLNVSRNCAFCKQKEDICHLLYECPRIKSIWCNISNCLQLNIMLKHIVLGITCDNYISENRNICIVIVSYAIYNNWYKTSINCEDYASSDIKKCIRNQLSFYGEVFLKLLSLKQRNHFRRLMECVLFHL